MTGLTCSMHSLVYFSQRPPDKKVEVKNRSAITFHGFQDCLVMIHRCFYPSLVAWKQFGPTNSALHVSHGQAQVKFIIPTQSMPSIISQLQQDTNLQSINVVVLPESLVLTWFVLCTELP